MNTYDLFNGYEKVEYNEDDPTTWDILEDEEEEGTK